MTDKAPNAPLRQDADEASLARHGRWLLIGLALFLFLLRWLGPSNLTDNDQERPASYVVDAVRNGHWMVQRDWTGDITSKPPLYTWLAALGSAVVGIGLGPLYLPCGLALAGVAWLVHRATLAAAGARVALLAGFFVLANPLSAKLVALARTDPVFTFTVTLTSVLVFQAWQTGRGWNRAWMAAALATLAKGPLGLALGFAGLAAAASERAPGRPRLRVRQVLPGAAWILVFAGGWFLLAWFEAGQPLIDKMLKAELVKHAVGDQGTIPGQGFVLAPAYFLGRFAPWSLLAAFGLWRAWRRPESDPTARRWQRFAAAGLVLGLVPFALASHQRGDLIAPLMPAGAILAAFPAARWTAAWPARRLLGICAVLGCAAAIAFQLQHTRRNLGSFRETAGLEGLAEAFRRGGGDPARLAHVDTPYALQYFLGTMHLAVTPEAAAQGLVRGSIPQAAVVDLGPLEAALGPDARRLRTVAQWPDAREARFRIVTLEPVSTNAP